MLSAGERAGRLLAHDDPPPYLIFRDAGKSPYCFVCDHAGFQVPRQLEGLGVSQAQLTRHIGWDIGASALASQLSDLMDATLILQPYSRLVIDCNRSLSSADSIVQISDGTTIPGNMGLNAQDIAQRQLEIHAAYHACIRATLDRRAAAGRPTRLVSVHSFTPILGDNVRSMEIGVLHDGAARLGQPLLEALRSRFPLASVGDNEPYALEEAFDYTVYVHGRDRGLPYAELEVRQDLLTAPQGVAHWAGLLAEVFGCLSGPFCSQEGE